MGSSKMCLGTTSYVLDQRFFSWWNFAKMEIKNKKFEKEFIWRVSIARSEGEKI
jgi:hypothetical protein